MNNDIKKLATITGHYFRQRLPHFYVPFGGWGQKSVHAAQRSNVMYMYI